MLRALSRRVIAPASQSRTYIALSAGNGDFGRLGHEATTDDFGEQTLRSLQTFHPIAALDGIDVRQVAAGGSHSAFLTACGHVFTCGLNDFGQLGHSANMQFACEPKLVELDVQIVFVATGHHHTVCVDVDGQVWSFGRNTGGQLGSGELNRFVPSKIEVLAREAKVKHVACGAEHTIAVCTEGRVFSWGSSTDGVLGHGENDTWEKGWFYRSAKVESKPRVVRALAEQNIVTIAAGYAHSACINSVGDLYTWGQGRFNQLGLDETCEYQSTPSRVQSLQIVHDVACGGLHTLANTNAGAMSWGANQHGELGLGRNGDGKSAVPKPIKLSSQGWTKIAAGWKHSAGIADGKLFSWGFGGSVGSHSDEQMSSGGQLGLGNEFDFWEPQYVPIPGEVKDVSLGFNHSLCLVDTTT